MRFGDLASNIGKVIPTAASLGVSLQEVLAAIVDFTRQGQSTSRATTDLTNVLSHIARPSQQARDEFKALGIEYGVNALKVKGLTGVLDDIILRTKGHTDTLIKLFPELRSYRGAVEAAQDSGKGFHEILQTLSHSTDGQGQTMRAATEVNKGAGQQIEKLHQEIATLQTEIGEKLLPTLRETMGHVRDVVKWFSNLSDGTKSNIVQIALWGSGALVTIGIIGRFVSALMGIVNAYKAVATWAGIAQAAQGGAAATGVATATGIGSRLLAGAGTAVSIAGRLINPATATAAMLLSAQRAGTSTMGDARPRGTDEQELATTQRRLRILQEQAAGATGDYGAELRANIAGFQQHAEQLKKQIAEAKASEAAQKLANDAKAAASKADADYAAKALKADPFPGAKNKKGKGDKDETPGMGDIIADHIKTATQSAPFKASCAFFVTEVLKQSGVAIKGSNSVKDLWQQLIGAGAEEVNGTLQRGDILKFHGKNFGTSRDAEGKGNHTGIYLGDGKFTDSHDFNTRRTTQDLASYMARNPDADVKALRLGDTNDRTSNLVNSRQEQQKDAADKRKEAADQAKEKADEKAEARAHDAASLDIGIWEERRSSEESLNALKQQYAADEQSRDNDAWSLQRGIWEERQQTEEYYAAKKKQDDEDEIARNKELLANAVWMDEVKQRDRESQQSLAAIQSPLQAAQERMRQTLQNMRQGVESILGGAFEKLFEGDSKHFFSDLLKGFTTMLAQMAARAVAMGIVNLLTGGAGGFLGGGGKGNGGFLGIFGFDDVTNDKKAAVWGSDFGRHFLGGMADYNMRHTPLAGIGSAGRGGDTHVNLSIGEVHNHTQEDTGRFMDRIAASVQHGLRQHVGTG
jgi:hypothetical protein